MDSRSTASTEPEIDLTKTVDERPAHHRLHSHLGHKRDSKNHERVPTTYPKPENDQTKVSDLSMFEKKPKHKKEQGDDDKYNMTWGECFKAMFCCGKK